MVSGVNAGFQVTMTGLMCVGGGDCKILAGRRGDVGCKKPLVLVCHQSKNRFFRMLSNWVL